MIARVRVVIDTPFEYDVGVPDENGNNPKMVEASKYAETTVLDSVKNAVTNPTGVSGIVIDEMCIVEEVREE